MLLDDGEDGVERHEVAVRVVDHGHGHGIAVGVVELLCLSLLLLRRQLLLLLLPLLLLLLLRRRRRWGGVSRISGGRRGRRQLPLLSLPLLLSRHLPHPPRVHRRSIFRLTIIRVVRVDHLILGPAERGEEVGVVPVGIQ